MAYLPLEHFVFRAPLLPARNGTSANLRAHPLGGPALAVASPELAAALVREAAGAAPGPKRRSPSGPGARPPTSPAELALARYARRAAFRPTPSGLLAGVGIGRLGQRTRIRTGAPRAHGHLSWTHLSMLGRALMNHPAVRTATRVRLAPSVIVASDVVSWLGPGRDRAFLEEARTAIDDVVAAVLRSATGWTGWTEVRAQIEAAVAGSGGEDGDGDGEDEDSALADSIDDVLLTMLDDGFLHSDLQPPLIGPLPSDWMDERLARLEVLTRGAFAADDRHGDGDADCDGDVTSGPAGARTEALRGGPTGLRRCLAEAAADARGGRFDAAAGRLEAWAARWTELAAPGAESQAPPAPGGPEGTRAPAVEATLRFGGGGAAVVVSGAMVRRAAALAPLLFRLQEALAPSVFERVPGPALADALAAATEWFGEGALDLGELAAGSYGVEARPARSGFEGAADDVGGDGDGDGDGSFAATDDLPDPDAPPPRALLTVLVNAIADARRTGRGRAAEVRLSATELDPVLPDLPPPPTCELFLMPAATSAWLLGLHGPAGASWGRFAYALSPGEQDLLFPPLVAAEREARPGEIAADVAYCPHLGLGNLCAHPAFRDRALALTHWPASAPACGGGAPGEAAPGDDTAVSTPATLELCADSAAPEPLALRWQGLPFAPSPLHRVRSTNAPPGIWRLLAGWRLCRQHRPWAMSWGPLGALDHLPRVLIDGFVVAPASWKLPDEIVRPPQGASTRSAGRARGASGAPASPDGGRAAKAAEAAARRRLRAWRARHDVPRFGQVGHEDELLPVDLESPGALADLRGHDRLFEIWPPPGDTPDTDGRRVELVVGLVDRPDAEARTHLGASAARVAATGAVPPPHRRQRLEDGAGWTTIKLFGVTESEDMLLLEVVAPAVAAARESDEIDAWFFQRYVDPPGRRAHLRVRVHESGASVAVFRARLEARLDLVEARARAAIVSVETAPYFPEAARYGGAAQLPFVHALFEADSDLACACLAEETRGGDGGGGAADIRPDGDPVDPHGDPHGDPLTWRVCALVSAFDALAEGLGLDPRLRRALAARRRRALLEALAPEERDGRAAPAGEMSEPESEVRSGWSKAFRLLKPRLRRMVSRAHATAHGRALREYARSVSETAAAARRLAVGGGKAGAPWDETMLAALLHVNAVRLLGPDRRSELAAYTLWERTLESLAHHPHRRP
jgi:hypothetical protein